MKTLLTEGLSSQGQRTLLTAGLGLLSLLEFAPGIAIAVLSSPSVALAIAAASVLLVQAQGTAADVVATTGAGTISATPGAATVSPAPSAIE